MTDRSVREISLRVVLPEGFWLRRVSQRFPDTQLLLIDGHALDDDQRVVFIGSASLSEEIISCVRDQEQVLDVVRVADALRVRFCSQLLRGFAHADLRIRYPMRLRDGRAEFSAFLSPAKLKGLSSVLSDVEVLSAKPVSAQQPVLTARQQEVLLLADSLGYFRYPRGVTLTELAQLLEVSKSTLSQALRAVERKAVSSLLDSLARRNSDEQ